MTLDAIALKGNSDKGPNFHCYTDIYDAMLSPIREMPVRLLELGILGGDSLTMWSRYFTSGQAKIIGVDIHDRGFASDDKRIQTIYGDASKPEFLNALQGPFDVVVEDASHFASHQMTAFIALWPKVSAGGWFIVEDIHTINSKAHCDAHINILEFFTGIAAAMQDIRGADGCAAPNPSDVYYSIESIEFRKGLIIVRKRG